MTAVHVVQFSTGIGSAEVLRRVVERHGKDDVLALTADTLAEDADNWRFAREVIALLECEWVVLADGRTPMQAGRDARAVPNNRMAICSRVLKREPLRRYIDARCEPSATVIYLGYDWTEPHRLDAARAPWHPYTVACPLMEPPQRRKDDLIAEWRARGIEPPSLYADGFAHANCGGGCVRSGQAQWRLLLTKRPAVYAEWEREEEQTRTLLDKDVAILRERHNGQVYPLPLRAFRERLEAAPALFDASDWGACGCIDDVEVSV